MASVLTLVELFLLKGTDDMIFPLRVCANKTMSPNIYQQKGVKGLKTKTVVRDLHYISMMLGGQTSESKKSVYFKKFQSSFSSTLR